MKKIAIFAILLQISCNNNELVPRNAFLVGEVKDRSGNSLSDVQIIVDNSLLFNHNLSVKTDENGQYSLEIPVGSWFAFAKLSKFYHGQTYHFYLNPENNSGFGREGGKRNFTWHLTGPRPIPLSGNFGGLITFDNFPGTYIDERKIQVLLDPITPLIDGTTGQKIQTHLQDNAQLDDVPIGRYRLQLNVDNQLLKLRKWNTQEDFKQELIIDFAPLIPGQCENCFKIEYQL